MKYVIVTGGVLSGLGKGITTSSLGMLLRARELHVTAIKIDPYLNCDAGTMNPFQHGEVFVLDDGSEVDMDFGNYERFIDVSLTTDHNITTGKVYREVIEKERRGDYLGNTVQIIPHITDEIKNEIVRVGEDSGVDVTLVELGGTVGDIESMPFLEAVRQLSRDAGRENIVFIHTTLVPILGAVKEQKTKPTQHSVRELRAIGIKPDIIVTRSERPLEPSIKNKISLFCDVPSDAVISAHDVGSIYEVPLLLEEQGLTDFVLKRFGFDRTEENLTEWKGYLDRLLNPKDAVNIALVGKYTHLMDSYISHVEALNHAGAKAKARVNIVWVESEDLEAGRSKDLLTKADGILVPGGFGDRGTQGKIIAIRFARENGVPFLGVCLGFQLATVEFSRHVAGMDGANSSEFDHDTPYPVVDLLPEQKEVVDMGATMRLGVHEIAVRESSTAERLYENTRIKERHRHRFEINPDFIDRIEKEGLEYTGRSMDDRRMEIAELAGHPYFVASQFHPEFKSRPLRPSPLHYGLVRASLERKRE
ncbi:MAG: CTP synthase (glutamine hydrolyzing) [Candidatus Thermoplasmatota archaeon]|nr:CTP synthase (glutamine hydrolyzing) [Candidatus Thermoplasmatota archaeon]